MCKYMDLSKGICTVSNEKCPYIFFCNKTLTYKPSNKGNDNCKVKIVAERPKGSYEVCFERHGNLYVKVGKYIEIVPNPYDYVPSFVKMTKTKNGTWRVKESI